MTRAHEKIEPIRGNARRRTLALLAMTGIGVLGVHFATADGTPKRAAADGAPGSRTGSESAKAEATANGAAPTFYVSAAGDDNADGTSPDTAWHSLARADQHVYLPGERLLLHGGDQFTGELSLKAGEAGDAAKPVQIGSYGAGSATIKAGQTPAISVYDTAGVSIGGLVMVGDGAAASKAAGVDVYNDLPGDKVLDGVTLSNLDVSGFRDGISVVGGNGASGFGHLRVSDSKVHGNRDNGLVSSGPPAPAQTRQQLPFHDFQVTAVAAYDNAGDPANHKTSTGSGIDLGGVDGGLIEGSTAYGNGGACDSSNGPVGIWIHDAANVAIRHDVSYSNRTAGLTDGGGFDIDQNTQNTVLEANLTYDNWGPGYMVYSSAAGVASTGNTVRYNVSIDDAGSPRNAASITYGSMMLAGFETGLSVHHNTVAQGSTSVKATLLNLGGHLLIGIHLQDTTIRDNIFAAGGGTLLDAGGTLSTRQVAMQGNDYSSAAGHWRMKWGSATFTTFTTWRHATGQEQLNGVATGTSADPGLTAAGAAAWDPTRTPVLAPKAAAAAATAGLDLTAKFGTDSGSEDYLGGAVAGNKALGAVARP